MPTILFKLIIAVVLTLCMSTTGETQTTGKGNSKNVLFLSTYQIDLPVNTLAVRAIQEQFQGAIDINVGLYYEYLDLNRFTDAGYQQALFDLYTRKYRGKPIDLVIANNQSMLELWLKHRQAILPDTPVIFYDMNIRRYADIKLPGNVTGAVSDVDHAKSVRWMLDVRPSIREVVIVHGVGPAEQPFLRDIDSMQTALRGRVQFTDWSSLPLTEMKRRAAVLPKTSVILYTLLFEDAAGVRYRPIDALRELATFSAVPILSGYDQFIGTGTIGSYMYSIEQQAREASRMGLRILRGETVSAIPVLKNHGTQFIFDHLALQRWNIPLSALPPDSIIKNRQYSVWELYQLQIIAIAIGFMVLFLLVAFLIVVTRRLNTAHLALSRLNADLETQVQERTTALGQTNHNLELEITEHKHAEEALWEERQRLTGIIKGTNVGTWEWNVQTGETIFNDRWAEIIGYTLDEISPVSIEVWMKYAYPDDLKVSGELLEKHFRGEIDYYEFESRMKHKDGHLVWVLDRGKVTSWTEEGKPLMMMGTHQDITERKREEDERDKLVAELQKALSEVKTLQGFLPICSYCKNIRDDKGYWSKIESYINKHSGAEFSHGICPECAKKLYPDMDLYDEDQTQG
jgi:PAS domain S-box-containing protein